MKSLSTISLLFCFIYLQSCVGIDLVDDPIIAERVTISPRIDTLPIGKEQVFSVKFTNQYGIAETPKSIIWRSSAKDKLTIDASGKAQTKAYGKVTIFATVGKVTDSLVLNSNTVASDTTFQRRGIFQPVNNSHNAIGNVRIQTVNGVSQIVTGANFSTTAGPSLYLLLANHTNEYGPYAVIPGSNAISAVSAQITANKLSQFSGVQTWTLPSNVNPADYKYAVLYCTLGFVFGTAELK